MGKNTTGKPSTNDYWIGRGIVYLAELESDDSPKMYKDVGNVPEITITVDSDTYDHYSSRSGLKVLDKSIVIEQTATMKFTLENIKDFDNLKYFFSGEAVTYTNPAAAGFVDAVIIKDGSIEVNGWYKVTDPTGAPIFQIDGANLTISTTNALPVDLVEDTDYTLDTVSGQIFLNDTAIVQTAISGVEGLTADYTADASAGTVDVMNAQTRAAVTVAIRFVGENAADSTNLIVDMHKVTISADGDFSLISDEVTSAPMTGAIEKSDNYPATIQIYDAAERTP